MTTMPGTLQRPWPPGTYEAAHERARDEARAAEWRQSYAELNEARARAGLPAFVPGWSHRMKRQ